jgi:N utilization substance protein B
MTDTTPKPKADAPKSTKRSAARLAAVQALYQMDIAQTDIAELVAEYEAYRLGGDLSDDGEMVKADAKFFRSIVEGVVKEQLLLDPKINAQLREDWALNRVDSIIRAIMRAGAYELYFRADVPPAVVVNEYMNVAKAFFEQADARIINAVLDGLAKDARQPSAF